MQIEMTCAADCLRHIRGSIGEDDYQQALFYINEFVRQQQNYLLLETGDLIDCAKRIIGRACNAPLSAEL